MDYRDYNDYELLSYVAEANEDALSVMFEKYQPLIQITANRMYGYCKNTGLEYNDLVQEGMLGLNVAILSYKNNKDTSFYTYAKTCIERRMITLVVGSTRQKHRFLNESVSYEFAIESDENYTNQKCLEDNSYNPENVLFDLENEEELVEKIKCKLTDFECQVFELKKNGFGYKEIAEILDKDIKAIDNALHRIRIKVKEIMGKE